MKRIRAFGVSATFKEQKQAFLKNARLIQGLCNFDCLSDAVIYAVNITARQLRTKGKRKG